MGYSQENKTEALNSPAVAAERESNEQGFCKLGSFDLKTLSDAAASGPWVYRPSEYDDWGSIRGALNVDDDIGVHRPPVARSSPLWGDYDFDVHRKDGTDPMEANGRFIVELVNAYREGRLVELTAPEQPSNSGRG